MTTPKHRLLPSLVDELAAVDPNRVLYSVPKTKDLQDGFCDIDARTLAHAVNRCAGYVEDTLGRREGFPTLMYLGPQDVTYAILVLATIKAGYKLLLTSPRNSLAAHLSLLEKTQCDVFLLSPNLPLPVVKEILAAREMRVVDMPGFQHWIEEGNAISYSYKKTFHEARLEPFVVLHTSGSTGLPKPIVQTHATVAALDALAHVSTLGLELGYPAMCAGKRVYVAFPLFHCAGLLMLLSSIFAGFTVVLGPFPPSAEAINAVHLYGNVQQSCLAAASLTDLANNPEYLENLTRLEQVTYGGGPLPRPVGDTIRKRARLLNCLGTTECGILPSLLCAPEDWAYLSYSPALGSEFREVSKGLYEHFIVRRPEYSACQGVFGTFPHLKEWAMKDLYEKHPTKDNLWLYKGRADDIIVFLTGEKLNPIDMEHAINASPSISVCLVIGVGRFQSSLLVEALTPPRNDVETKELVSAIWPFVEAANKNSPSHARIHRDMIIFTAPGKPMLRAGKGSVQRQLTVELYNEEINALYNASADLARHQPKSRKSEDNGVGVLSAIKQIIAQTSAIDLNRVSDNDNLFELGLDSLQVISTTKEINSFLADHGVKEPLGVKAVYANPTITTLVDCVAGAFEGRNVVPDSESEKEKMQKLIDKHTQRIPITARLPDPRRAKGRTVLLTGSTGSLGSYILDSLFEDISVERVYCLNRGRDSRGRQQDAQRVKGLRTLPDNVEFLDAELSGPCFGLGAQQYRKLLNEVDIVIHNAWQVDFNLILESFADQIDTVSRIIEFAVHSKFNASIFFISSISATNGVSRGSAVAEQVHDDLNSPEATGYGQSKFVAERLLDAAAREVGVPATVCRVGQIAGPTTEAGMWPKQEWLPTLVASSRFLGKLPASLGPINTIDWIPVDDLGRIVVELATGRPTPSPVEGVVVYHTVNPQKTNWEVLIPTVCEEVGGETGLEVVTLENWVEALRESASADGTGTVSQNPGVKLLDFFESLVVRSEEATELATDNAVATSPKLAALGAIQAQHMKNWITQWAF